MRRDPSRMELWRLLGPGGMVLFRVSACLGLIGSNPGCSGCELTAGCGIPDGELVSLLCGRLVALGFATCDVSDGARSLGG